MIRIRDCSRCGKSFEREAKGGKPRQECDRCYVRHRTGPLTSQCERCQAMFAPMWGKPNRWCSKECMTSAPTIIACAFCGTVTRVPTAQREHARFCSNPCWYKARHAAALFIGPEPPPVDDCRWIRFTGGFTVVDSKNYDRLNEFAWSFKTTRSGDSYAIRHCYEQRRKIYMHSDVLGNHDNHSVDHRNGVTLDNRESNLRPASATDQMCNTRKRKGCTSRFKGVFAHSYGGFRASVGHKGTQRHIGSFKTEVEAALARDAAARELHGSFGTYNFPLEGEQSALR